MGPTITLDRRTNVPREARVGPAESLTIVAPEAEGRAVVRVRHGDGGHGEILRATVEHDERASLAVSFDQIAWRRGTATLVVERAAAGDPYRDQSPENTTWTALAEVRCETSRRAMVKRALAISALAPAVWAVALVAGSRGAASLGVHAVHAGSALFALGAAVFTIRARSTRAWAMALACVIASLGLAAFERRASVRVDNQSGRALRQGFTVIALGSSRALSMELRAWSPSLRAQGVERRESDPCSRGRSRPRWTERALVTHTLRAPSRFVRVHRAVEQFLFDRAAPRTDCDGETCCVDASTLRVIRGTDGRERFAFHLENIGHHVVDSPTLDVLVDRASLESARGLGSVNRPALAVYAWPGVDVQHVSVRVGGWEFSRARGDSARIEFERYPALPTTPIEFEIYHRRSDVPIVLQCDANETIVELFADRPAFAATRPAGAGSTFFVRCGNELSSFTADTATFGQLSRDTAPTLEIPSPNRQFNFTCDDVGELAPIAQHRAMTRDNSADSETGLHCPSAEPTFDSWASLACDGSVRRAFSVRSPQRSWEVRAAYVLPLGERTMVSPSKWFSQHCAYLDEECDTSNVAWPFAMVCFDPRQPPIVRVTINQRGAYFLPESRERQRRAPRDFFARPRFRDGQWRFVAESFDRRSVSVCCESRSGRWSDCPQRYFSDPAFAANEYLDPVALDDASARDARRPPATRSCTLFAQRRFDEDGLDGVARDENASLWSNE